MKAARNMPGIDERREIARMALDAGSGALMERSAGMRDAGHGNVVTYSRKVFIPLTQLCRDVCHYCTFAKAPRELRQVFLSPEQVLEIAASGKNNGCKEALFTLGDEPEMRYKSARTALEKLGYRSTLDYLEAMAERVLKTTGLLPHINCGIMSREEMSRLRCVSASMGLMLETSSPRLGRRGGPHHGSPDKDPEKRLACIREAGELGIPFTSGILVGIGETRAERLDSLLELAALHERYGHLQEILIQNFVPKCGTRMHAAAPPSLDDMLWTVASARLIFGPEMSIQAPPNLNPERLGALLAAGINDWGGVSPVTPDHVNPESPWPHLDALAGQTLPAVLTERLTVYPRFIRDHTTWLDERVLPAVLRLADADGCARTEHWAAGGQAPPPPRMEPPQVVRHTAINGIIDRSLKGETLGEREIVELFRARGRAVWEVCRAADQLRRQVCGDTVTYVVNRNINYTNVCTFSCFFCAYAKGKTREAGRDKPYLVSLDEIARRTAEAWQLGATEVCMQGGIHPEFTGQTYLDICRAAKNAASGIHIHAFSPLEISHGAATLGISVAEFLQELKRAGLATLPGTAAEILDDRVRALICPDKIRTREWLDIVKTAHATGLKTTSTIMFGHVEHLSDWATHLLAIRQLQMQTGGITEFVPLPFVHMEAPLFLRSRSRPGPTFRETLLMHAVARLTLHPCIRNIQVSWPKLGLAGAAQCLESGANDLGGTLMNESISRAAGALHGQCLTPEMMTDFIQNLGRTAQQRSTLYDSVDPVGPLRSFSAERLQPVVNGDIRRAGRGEPALTPAHSKHIDHT